MVGDVKLKLNKLEESDLEVVDFLFSYSSDLCVVLIFVIVIVLEFCSHHNACHDKSDEVILTCGCSKNLVWYANSFPIYGLNKWGIKSNTHRSNSHIWQSSEYNSQLKSKGFSGYETGFNSQALIGRFLEQARLIFNLYCSPTRLWWPCINLLFFKKLIKWANLNHH